MTQPVTVTVERVIPHPPEKIWRALTQPHLMEEWLMKTDFKPEIGHHFTLRGDWGGVECEVLAIEPEKTLSYTWNHPTTIRPIILKARWFSPSLPLPREPICAWSRPASAPIRNRPSAAPNGAGRKISPIWKSCCRGSRTSDPMGTARGCGRRLAVSSPFCAWLEYPLGACLLPLVGAFKSQEIKHLQEI